MRVHPPLRLVSLEGYVREKKGPRGLLKWQSPTSSFEDPQPISDRPLKTPPLV